MSFLKRIFTWWNGSTIGTNLQIRRKAREVGSDEYGNKYFEQKSNAYDGRLRRWVTYTGYADASRVPPEWQGWLNYTRDKAPTNMKKCMIGKKSISQTLQELFMLIDQRAPLPAVASDQKLHQIMNLGVPMTRVVLFIFVLFNTFLLLSPFAYSANMQGNHVILRTLDKVTAITEDYRVAVGDDLRYGSLTISVKNCQRTPPEEIPETYAFIQIDDLILGSAARRWQTGTCILRLDVIKQSSNQCIGPFGI